MGDVNFGTSVSRSCKPLDLEPVDIGPFLFKRTPFYSQCGKGGIFSDDYAKFKVERTGIKIWFSPGTVKTSDSFDIYINKYGQVFGDLPNGGINKILDVVDCAAKLSPNGLKPAVTKARTVIKDALRGDIRPDCDNSLDFWGIDLRLFTVDAGMMLENKYRMKLNDQSKYDFEYRTLYLSSTGAIKEPSSSTYSIELFDKVMSAVEMLLNDNPESAYLRGLLEFLNMSAEDPGNLPHE